MSWRDIARPVIAAVLKEHELSDEKTRRKALRDAYPFGSRMYHPYKIWCDEIKVQLGKRRFGGKINVADPGQQNLFNP